MSNSRILFRALCGMLVVLLAGGSAAAFDTNIGVKAGVITDATFDFEPTSSDDTAFELDSQQSWSAQAFVEGPLYGNFRSVLSLDYHRLGNVGKSEMILQAGLGARYNFTLDRANRYAVGPGVSVGYGYLGDTRISDAGNLIMLTVSSEFVIFSEARTGFMFELAGLWALSGTADDFDVDGGPMLLVRGGLYF
ncbi:hypothetical protein GF377_06650 [candidate division GN15 bacterium]|nr:hypothetical protein [candidate division GN15 bacterium]